MKQYTYLIALEHLVLRRVLSSIILALMISTQAGVLAADHDDEKTEQHHQHKDDKEHGHAHESENQQHDKEQYTHKQGHEYETEKHNEDKHGEDEADEGAELKFSTAELQEFGIKLSQAKAGVINKTLELTGEVIVAPESLYHVVPRVSGVVLQVFMHLGDSVKAGDLLATLSSRDLADAKAKFVASNSLLKLANANLSRERDLYKNKVTAKREYLAAKQVQTEMSINRKAAEQRLLSIGLTDQAIDSVLNNSHKDLTLYELRAPADGIIIEKHAVQGEVLDTVIRSFTIADLSQVWVNLTIYQKDLPFIQQGQQVLINTRFGLTAKANLSASTISWISPTLDKKTRSANARVVIDNPENNWRPGLFVSAKVAIENTKVAIVIEQSALQTIEAETIVFVQHKEGVFKPQVVQVGRRDYQNVEILQGLEQGQVYVSHNAFVLKAQSQKSSFGHGHSH